MTLPADKGTAIVCENEKEYVQKVDDLIMKWMSKDLKRPKSNLFKKSNGKTLKDRTK